MPESQRGMNAPSNPASLQKRLQANLPDPLLKAQRWLLWRAEGGRKVPYYADGTIRRGTLDTPEDIARLATFDEAVNAYLVGEWDGLGFALTGEGIGAFDIDKCLDANGALIAGHAGHDLATKAKEAGAYIETSPSGRGLRIVGRFNDPSAYSAEQVEAWTRGRYVTLTGEVWANARKWIDLTHLRSSLRARTKPEDARDDDEGPIITPKTIVDLRDALRVIDADERDLWVRLGHALKALPGKYAEDGKALWLEWSTKSPKFDEADALAKWDTFKPTNTDHRAVFAEAKRCGWNAKATTKPKPKAVTGRRAPIDLAEDRLHPTEFVLDGFIPAGVSVIAGAWGAGKSTNLIPLMASVAHLAPASWGFWPDLRRHIIWITEAPEQARDTLWSLHKAEGAASWQGFKDWFHLYPSRRDPADDLAEELRGIVDEHTIEGANGYRVKPVVVLDTTTANIDLENENDNAQVGAAMSAFKQAMPGTPLILVGHTPKAMMRADITDMTFRGAGAWEAEAAATFLLGWDQDADMRFLAIRKARFTPTYREIDFGHESGSVILDTPWGEPQTKQYLHGVPAKSNGEARRAARQEIIDERREQAKSQAQLERQDRALQAIRHMVAKGELATKNAVHKAIGGDKTLCLQAIDALIDAGLITAHLLGKDDFDRIGLKPKGRAPEVLLPSEVEFDAFCNTLAKENH